MQNIYKETEANISKHLLLFLLMIPYILTQASIKKISSKEADPKMYNIRKQI